MSRLLVVVVMLCAFVAPAAAQRATVDEVIVDIEALLTTRSRTTGLPGREIPPGAARVISRVDSIEASGDPVMCIAELESAIACLTPHDADYSALMMRAADYYSAHGHRADKAFLCLSQAARSDLICGYTGTASLVRLSAMLREQGRDRLADSCMAAVARTLSRDESVSGEFVAEVRRQAVSDVKRTWWRFIVIAAGLSLIISAIIFTILRNRRLRKSVNTLGTTVDSLRGAMEAKDRAVKSILSLCEAYVESSDEFLRISARKLRAGQAQDLFRQIESGTLVAERTSRFTDTFDSLFLDIYPDFVAELNSRCTPDRRIAVEDGSLNPELRIAALIRLGVDDSARISKFLGLSLNTVYTYRNRLRSRAAKRDEFDTFLARK